MRSVTVEIIFTDGSAETVQDVHDTFVKDFVLYLRRVKPSEHLGSWPLVNIRKWTVSSVD